jgi:arsenite oxidase large subunit
MRRAHIQTGYHNKYNSYVRGRYPMAIIEMHPDDMASLKIEAGDIVEVPNDWGATFAMVYPEPGQKPGQTFMQFGYDNGAQGDVTTNWNNRNIIPYYKGTWANIRRVGGGAEHRETISFKSRRYDQV